jgi:DNA-directed RNA polymerase subunit M/transcription elongation factor TFIIS
MSHAIICHGCGQPVEIPEGYRRNKIQCPTCGVISPVTAPAPATRGGRSDEDSPKPATRKERPGCVDERWAAEFLSTPDPPAPDPEPFAEEPEPPSPPGEELAPTPPARAKRKRAAAEKKPAFEMTFACRRCGRKVRRQGECPFCDASPPGSGEEQVPDLSVDGPADEADDGAPYELDGGNDVKCPKCTNMLPPDGVVCTRCGWHLRRRKKLLKTYQPLARSWETNYSLRTRRTIWGLLQFLAFAAGLAANLALGASWPAFAGSMVLFALMTSFLLGTFDRLDLVRNDRGKVTLTKTRRICFFTAYELPIDVRGHEGVVTGRRSDVTGWEWLVFFFLLLSGIIPGLVWWYYVIHKITFHAALARDHGYPSAIVYQGWDEEQMRDIAVALSGAAGLRLEIG